MVTLRTERPDIQHSGLEIEDTTRVVLTSAASLPPVSLWEWFRLSAVNVQHDSPKQAI